MRATQLLLATQKETPADAVVISHQLMLRAGMIRKSAAGLYSWLPLGLRVLRKVEQIVREEMDKSGAQEVLMPVVQPSELWLESGRWEQFGPEDDVAGELGCDGVGLELAGFLAREARARLVLLGRSPVPPREEWAGRAGLARLLTFPNVLITSHQAFLTREALDAIATTTLENIRVFEAEGRAVNEVRVADVMG